MSRFVNFIFIFVISMFFIACGGGGGGATGATSTDPQITTINGVVIDGYIKNATVCIDSNKDNSCAGERTTTSNNQGEFSFSNVTLTDDMVILAYGGEDAETSEPFSYIVKNLVSNKDTSTNKVVLSSINTLITDYKLLTNKSLEASREAIAVFIDSFNPTTDIIKDVIANKDEGLDREFLRSLKLFQMVASINDTNNSTNSAKSFKAIAQAIAQDESLILGYQDIEVSVNGTLKQIPSSFVSKPVLLQSPTLPTVIEAGEIVDLSKIVVNPDAYGLYDTSVESSIIDYSSNLSFDQSNFDLIDNVLMLTTMSTTGGDFNITVRVKSTYDDTKYIDIPLRFTIDPFTIGFSLDTQSLSLSEDDQTFSSFNVVLNIKPNSNVVLSIDSNDTSEVQVLTKEVTFTPDNWNTPQQVRVKGVNDNIIDGDQESLITVGVSSSADSRFGSALDQNITVTTSDDDVAGVELSKSSLIVNENGLQDTFTVVLTKQPLSDVVFDINSTDPLVATVSPEIVRFTPSDWNISQTITVTGVDDGAQEGSSTTYINLIVSNGESDDAFDDLVESISVNSNDNDIAGLTYSPEYLTVSEDENVSYYTKSFAVVLNTVPTHDVQIDINITNYENLSPITLSHTNLTFTIGNWNTPQTVMITGVNDNEVNVGERTANIELTGVSDDGNYSGGPFGTIYVTIEDLKNKPPVITEGESIAKTTNEDTELVFTLHATDPEADTLLWDVESFPSNGDLDISVEDGTVTYTPYSNFSGTDMFYIIVSDEDGNLDRIEVNVTIAPINDKPFIVTTEYGDYNQSEYFTTDSLLVDDPEIGDTHTFAFNPDPHLGSLDINTTTGAVFGLIGDTGVGEHIITVRVTDQNGSYSDQNISLIINELNDTPSALQYKLGSAAAKNWSPTDEANITIEVATKTTPISFILSGISDGEEHMQQSVTLTAHDYNASIVTVTITDHAASDGTASVTLSYQKGGKTTLRLRLTDDGTPDDNIKTKDYLVNIEARGTGWDIYNEQKLSGYTISTVTFDDIVYDWNATQKWYEQNLTQVTDQNISLQKVLLPIQNITNSAYIGADLNISNSGHYSMNKNKIIAESTIYPSSASSTNYTTAKTFFTADGSTKIVAKDNKFAYDGNNSFFVSRVLIDSSNLKSYNDNPSTLCAANYGTGWRIPTAVEIGNSQRTSDKYGQYIAAYVGDLNKAILTTSFENGSTNSILGLWMNDAYWDVFAKTTGQYFRCIYQP